MNDANLMTRFESVRHLSRDHHRLVDRNEAFRDPLGKRRSFHKLEHERCDAV